ncbi:MAG TPA: bifunctional diaminohydroxyphosphoribosylaminopyrimidine deaminase/5-amino-6-(5-phosphoribosylamino)uracil reductase RibD [Abditibacteriaceae bacterium]|jgi:diaminohydroxyphosphoribosylaminopyrimidine deaminase/5-amino-6-(5-phosphoribosylamino)uracil reductase
MSTQERVHSDADGMRAALRWNQKGRGWTSPRPSVGCTLVRDGVVIGGGHTQPGDGNPHAEVMALRAVQNAGLTAEGATAYVTLEPCSHWRTTPPCSDALIAAGIKRVVCGVRDPNPCVDGRGFDQLRTAGIEVVENFMVAECARAQDDFLKHIATGLPLVTLKCAVSLDGKIATSSGQSQWITGEASRRRVHQMRHEHDAVLVGIETVLADDPQLSVRLEGQWKQPARVILDSRGRLPLHAKVLQSRESSTRVFVATTAAMPPATRQALADGGAEIIETQARDGRVDLAQLWKRLGEHGICSVLIEGGAQVAGAALASGTVDKVQFFVAPLLIGQGRSALESWSVTELGAAPRLHDVWTEGFGDDTMIGGYLTKLY